MFPVATAESVAELAAEAGVLEAPVSGPHPVDAAAAAEVSSSVAFSRLAQFLSAVGLSRRQLQDVQTSQLAGAQLALLGEAAANLAQAYNQLPSPAIDTAPPLPGGVTLSDRLARALREMGASAPGALGGTATGDGSAVTLADIGIAFVPLASASAIGVLRVDTSALNTAFNQDSEGTLALLERVAAQFSQFGNAVARRAGTATPGNAAMATTPSAASASSAGGDGAEAVAAAAAQPAHAAAARAAQDAVASGALRAAIADSVPQPETQADRLAADRAAGTARLSQDERTAAAAQAAQDEQRIARTVADAASLADALQAEARRVEAARAAGLPAPPLSSDPAVAAAVAAFNAATIAAASARTAYPPPASDALRPGSVAPVQRATPVQRIQPIQPEKPGRPGRQEQPLPTPGDAAAPRR